MCKPRVFVSSVVEGFASYREAARVAIIGAGGKPVLVNEELMASDTSSRNACLDAVESWSARLEMCQWRRETLDKESIWDEARSTNLSRW